ncbi:DNA polymerase III subunit beta [Aliikangiella coralliicola]|uniref:Beta sliding clamp n=1 Tax=Aliikangiella coralliicola TaxID=2592383 RepID=A0A545UGJ3_9GAMM|nr:DNA polymerase III subunit beta [Aliikangiella coralliicola]TQV88591.1 DNA polymerase III subunit beta [Aliikangiella coralliicola]
MKFSIGKEELVAPLQLISGAVEKRQTLPVLANLLLKIDNGQLTLTATDLEIEMSANLPLEGEYVEGDITVPARKLLDICKSLSDDNVIEITLDENKLRISSGKNRFSLSTISAQEFPNIEEAVFNLEFEIETGDFKNLFDKTQFAMALQDVRYYLNGMLLEINGANLVSVATDGHRLALSKIELEQPVNEELMQAIVPRKGILEAGKLLSSAEGKCKVELSSNHIRITLGTYVFTSKLIDGRFPDYDKVLPRNSQRLLVADKGALKDAFSRASILCNEKFRGVRLDIKGNLLEIHANNPEQEEAEIELDVDYNDEDLEIGFNVGYLLDALNVIQSENVRFNLGDSNSSVLIENADSSDSLYVVMPMRL